MLTRPSPTTIRQRRSRARRKVGRILLRIEVDEYDLVATLQRTNRLSIEDGLHRARVEQATAFAERALWNVGRSLRLNAGELDHLAPFLSFVGDELAEIGGGTRKHLPAQVGEPSFQFGIGECGVDLRVELVDDFTGCVFRRSDAEPRARLVARQEIDNGWEVRQPLPARRTRYGERTQPAAPDVFD